MLHNINKLLDYIKFYFTDVAQRNVSFNQILDSWSCYCSTCSLFKNVVWWEVTEAKSHNLVYVASIVDQNTVRVSVSEAFYLLNKIDDQAFFPLEFNIQRVQLSKNVHEVD